MAKKRILIVDDEKAFTEMLKLNLESTGTYDIKIQNDSKNVILTAMEFCPNLILLDVIMPYKDGPEVFIELQNNSQLNKIPVIFLTATVTSEEAKAQEGIIGGHKFIAKPCSFETLLYVIETTITSNIFSS